MNFLEIGWVLAKIYREIFWIVALLTQLTRKSEKFIRGENQEKSFQELKTRLTSAPILAIPLGMERYVIYSDASKFRLECVLIQHRRVITYASRQLRTHEKYYP